MGAMKPLLTPEPWLLTVLFFAVELIVTYHWFGGR
jgi:hypothetical protein